MKLRQISAHLSLRALGEVESLHHLLLILPFEDAYSEKYLTRDTIEPATSTSTKENAHLHISFYICQQKKPPKMTDELTSQLISPRLSNVFRYFDQKTQFLNVFANLAIASHIQRYSHSNFVGTKVPKTFLLDRTPFKNKLKRRVSHLISRCFSYLEIALPSGQGLPAQAKEREQP